MTTKNNDYFLIFSAHFDRDKGLDWGRTSLIYPDGQRAIWMTTTSTANKQYPESFHEKGAMIPPHYRCGLKHWELSTIPIYMPNVRGVEGNFYKIDPHTVKTDKGGIRGDFGYHADKNVPGSLGCPVMAPNRFADFEKEMKILANAGIKKIRLYVQYS